MAAGIPIPGGPRKICDCPHYVSCSCAWGERTDEMPSGLNEADVKTIVLNNIDKDLRPSDLIVLGDHTYDIYSIKYCYHGEIVIEVHWKSSKITD